MIPLSINKIRIKLLTKCFSVSLAGIIINMIFLVSISPLTTEAIFYACIWTLFIMSTTGIVQVIGNEIWLVPVIYWLNSLGEANHQVKKQKKFLSTPKLALFFLIFLSGGVGVGFIILRLFISLNWRQFLILLGIGFIVGISFLLSWFLVQRWQAKKISGEKTEPYTPLEIVNAFLKFPIKSAGLSLLLWFYAGVTLSLGFYYLGGFTKFESIYILFIACNSGILAFPFQYLLFKRTLSEPLQIFLTQHPQLMEEGELFQISFRYKLFVYFIALSFFTIIFSFIFNYSYSLMTIKNKLAIIYQSELSQQIRKGLQNPQGVESLKSFLSRQGKDSKSYFIISGTGKLLYGALEQELSHSQLQEMLKKKKGAILRTRSGAMLVFDFLPSTNLLLGKIYSWRELNQEFKNIQILTGFFVILMIAISGVFAFLVSNEISSPLRKIIAEAQLVSRRDFEERTIPLSDDEIIDLTRSFWQMRAQIKNYINHLDMLIDKIGNTVLQIDETTRMLSQVAQEQNEGASHQAVALEQVYQVLEKLSANARQLSDKSQAMENSANQTLQAYQSGISILNDAIDSVKAGKNQMDRIRDIMKDLESQATQIKKIVEITEEIATQSNLLALNALLEANVAGELGSRFSVVANEMKRLALMSQKFNTNIGKIVSEALGSVNSTIEAVRGEEFLLERSTQLAIKAGEYFSGFSSLIDLSVTTSQDIANSVDLHMKINEEITQALSEIKVVALQLKSRTTEIETTLDKLVTLGEELKTLISERQV